MSRHVAYLEMRKPPQNWKKQMRHEIALWIGSCTIFSGLTWHAVMYFQMKSDYKRMQIEKENGKD